MSHHLRLATDIYYDSDSKIDLLDGVLKLTWGGYQPGVTAQHMRYDPRPYGPHHRFSHFGYVTETLSLGGAGSPAELQAAADAIERCLEQARTYPGDILQVNGRWLEWMAEGEPENVVNYGSKRAFIYDGHLGLTMPDGFKGGFLDTEMWATLALVRHPFWENPTRESAFSSSLGWGDVIDITAEKPDFGTAPSRISLLSLYGMMMGGSTYPDQVWLGLRPERTGFTDFDPVWELEDGTIVDTDDTSSDADGTASGGDRLTTTFSTNADLIERVTIRLDQAHPAIDWTDFIGRYLVLGRFRTTVSASCGIKMLTGWNDEASAGQEEVFFGPSDWQMIELGEVQIPSHPWREVLDGSAVRKWTISLYTERLSGSGSLYMDALYFIPAEHLLTFKGLGDTTVSADIKLYTTPDDHQVLAPDAWPPEWSARDWYLPTDAGFVVACMQDTTAAHDLSFGGNMYLYYFPRWRLYRTA